MVSVDAGAALSAGSVFSDGVIVRVLLLRHAPSCGAHDPDQPDSIPLAAEDMGVP